MITASVSLYMLETIALVRLFKVIEKIKVAFILEEKHVFLLSNFSIYAEILQFLYKYFVETLDFCLIHVA